jgi:Arc/MetJ-type ribon-helix-helix transcriptional regulator
MVIKVTGAVEKMIQDRIASGAYETPEAVVLSALGALDASEQVLSQFQPGELDSLIAEGLKSGEPIDGAEWLAKWRALRTGTTAAAKS